MVTTTDVLRHGPVSSGGRMALGETLALSGLLTGRARQGPSIW